jgi:tetratricopeptide (TPR) repeat protein
MTRLPTAAMALILLASALWAAQNPVDSAQGSFQAGQFAQAASTLQQALEADPNDAALDYWLGRCYFELRNYQQASEEEERAVKLNGQVSDYHFWLGKIYGRLAEQHHSLWLGIKTGKEFDAAVQLDPQNIPARRALAEFYASAPWIVGGSRSKAREQIAAVAAQDPIQGELAEADYDHTIGNLAEAQVQYQKVLATSGAAAVEYYEAADFYTAQNDAADLQTAINDVLRVAPNDPRLGYYHGVLLAIEGTNLEEAETDLKAYLAATVNRSDYPPQSDARTWLGHVYEKMGRRLAAAEQYRAALEMDPESGFAKQSLQQLEKQMN